MDFTFTHFDFNILFNDEDADRVPRLTFFARHFKGVDSPPRYNVNLDRVCHHYLSLEVCLFRRVFDLTIYHSPFRYALMEEGVLSGAMIWRKKLKKVYL